MSAPTIPTQLEELRVIELRRRRENAEELRGITGAGELTFEELRGQVLRLGWPSPAETITQDLERAHGAPGDIRQAEGMSPAQYAAAIFKQMPRPIAALLVDGDVDEATREAIRKQWIENYTGPAEPGDVVLEGDRAQPRTLVNPATRAHREHLEATLEELGEEHVEPFGDAFLLSDEAVRRLGLEPLPIFVPPEPERVQQHVRFTHSEPAFAFKRDEHGELQTRDAAGEWNPATPQERATIEEALGDVFRFVEERDPAIVDEAGIPRTVRELGGRLPTFEEAESMVESPPNDASSGPPKPSPIIVESNDAPASDNSDYGKRLEAADRSEREREKRMLSHLDFSDAPALPERGLDEYDKDLRANVALSIGGARTLLREARRARREALRAKAFARRLDNRTEQLEAELEAARGELGELRTLLEVKTKRTKPDPAQLAFWRPSPVVDDYHIVLEARVEELLREAVRDVAKRLARCYCGKRFIRKGRRTYCSSTCSQRIRTARFDARHEPATPPPETRKPIARWSRSEFDAAIALVAVYRAQERDEHPVEELRRQCATLSTDLADALEELRLERFGGEQLD